MGGRRELLLPLRMKYADRLLKHIEENPHFIQPESRRNEMVSFIQSGLGGFKCFQDYL